jgi:thymidine kinase
MAELVFFCGTMDCGKSTLALQLTHNREARGLAGLRFTRHDRAGQAVLSSRLGLVAPAIEVAPELDFWAELVAERTRGRRVDFAVCDEAQFYTPDQVEQLARVVDEMAVDVFAFGITADFRTRLFPGSQRLIELADRVEVLQVEALCWCGARATHNARTVGGVMVVEGEQVVVGDVAAAGSPGAVGLNGDAPAVGYETLCRRHHHRRMSSAVAHAAVLSPDLLPFDLEQRDVPVTHRL